MSWIAEKNAFTRWAKVDHPGKWPVFLAKRSRYQLDGMEPQDSWIRAMKEVGWQIDPTNLPKRLRPDQSPQEPQAPARSEPKQPPPQRPAKMVNKATFKGKPKATPLKVVEWVAAHIGTRNMQPTDAPSAEAWFLLQWVRESDVNRAEFWRNIWTKRLPSKSQIDERATFTDDDREILSIIGRVEKATNGQGQPVLPPGPQGAAGKPAVPPGHAQAGS